MFKKLLCVQGHHEARIFTKRKHYSFWGKKISAVGALLNRTGVKPVPSPFWHGSRSSVRWIKQHRGFLSSVTVKYWMRSEGEKCFSQNACYFLGISDCQVCLTCPVFTLQLFPPSYATMAVSLPLLGWSDSPHLFRLFLYPVHHYSSVFSL